MSVSPIPAQRTGAADATPARTPANPDPTARAVPGGPAAGEPAVESTLVIGVSIAVPEPYAQEIQDARDGFGDPLARSIPTHVTLLPPTELDPAELPAVARHLARAARRHLPFRLRLRGTDTFRPVSPVVFVRLDEGVREVREVESSVRCGPLARELAFPFHPHVTVAHNVEPASLDRAERELRHYRAEFTVAGFSLHRFCEDRVWRPLRSFGFAG